MHAEQELALRRVIIRRVAMVIAALLLAWAMHYAITGYLHDNREYHGFTYRPPDLIEILCIVSLVMAVALVLPTRISRPSSVVILFMFLMVFVPSVVISLCLDVSDRLERYGPGLCALAISMVAASLTSRSRLSSAEGAQAMPGNGFTAAMSGTWLLVCAVLMYAFGSIMSLASFVDVYIQRELGTADVGLGMGYAQTYFSTVLSPALFAIGLLRRKWWLMGLGLAGCFLMYLIAAQRAVLLIPVAMLLVYLLHAKSLFNRSMVVPVVLTSAIIVTCIFFSESIAGELATSFIVDRTFALPGLTFSQYHDIFAAFGHTYWSHVRGFDLFVAPPEAFVGYPDWPGLGYMVGAIFYGSRAHNVNANPFSADGLAAAGAPGVLVIGLVFCAWLYVLDRVVRGWDMRYAILATVPIALLLTNGQFFTTMLSFGGFFWLLIFALYKPKAAP